MMSFNFPPKGWALCNGQLLPINQNQALFSLLGTTYGGDGRTNFALPNLGGRVPIHFGSGLFGPPVNLGEQAGEVNHTLLDSELPGHGHYLTVQSKPADAVAASAGNSLLAQGSVGMYGESVGTALNPSSIGNTGGSQPHTNMQPYLTLSFCIALQGIFPSQN